MTKITFLGAGSTIFAKNIIGDIFLTPALQESQIALYDIDPVRLEESRLMVDTLNTSINAGRAIVTAHLGEENRREALKDANYIVNAIQVGGYRPSTVIDFEIPKRYGLRQTIGDTLGIGGIFRGLRTIPVMLDFAADIEAVCPEAWFLNYTNPMAILTGAMLKATQVKSVGLCHSVQVCVPDLLKLLDFEIDAAETQWKIYGINHMAWLLELTHRGEDLYPKVRNRAAELNRKAREEGAEKHEDMVRLEMMRHFGYYLTESSEHNAEYTPYWIKSSQPDLTTEFNIPLDEYPRRCEEQIAGWAEQKREILSASSLEHARTHEYGARIIEGLATGEVFSFHGNLLNRGLIPNLPAEAVVEVPCIADRNGIQGVYAGSLPPQCAALNMTNINVQLLTIDAALQRSRELVYQAAYLDPHTAADLNLDQIRNLCDELIDAHGEMLPVLK